MRSSRLKVSVVAAWAGAALAGGCADKMVQPAGSSGGDCVPGGPCGGGFAVDDGGIIMGGPGLGPSGAGGSSGPRPSFRSTVTASVPPPPISGGTLLVTRDGATAVAADPDRDVLYVVDIAGMTVRSTIALKAGDEPGRLVQDGDGRVHVALRGGGALVTIDPSTGSVLARRSVCPAPRGVVWDSTRDSVWVACATGELVQMPSGGGAATLSLHVERDLRDVVVDNGALSITSFRAAQILRIGSDGRVARRDPLGVTNSTFLPQVAWRAAVGPLGVIFVVHQQESIQSIATHIPGGYGGGGVVGMGGGFDDAGAIPPLAASIGQSPDAGVLFEGNSAAPQLFEGDSSVPPLPSFGASSIVMSVLSAMGPDGNLLFERSLNGVLPVDVALSPDGLTLAGVTPGSAFTPFMSNFFMVSASSGVGPEDDRSLGVNEQPIAVAFDASDHLIVQSREPAKLWLVPRSGGNITSVQLSAGSRDDTGHDVFHTQAGAQIACASCHPEGGDDGHVWLLDGAQRRTPSLRGTIAGTAPYHWPGDQPDLTALVNDVYTVRMSGASLPPDQMGALTGWVQTIPPPPAPTWVDASAASHGRAVFESSETKCASCHLGSKFTNNATVDVGTGGAFQVPPLVGVGWRTPLMHDGCATAIADRFGACSTPGHGDISKLSAQDIGNLSAYLETL